MLNERNYKPLQHKNMKYKVQIVETLVKYVEVEANDEHEALSKIELEYENGNIVLSSENYDTTDFYVEEVE